MILNCILDDCPITGESVDHRDCCKCKHNPLKDGQPDFGRQDCQHPKAKHDPNPENMEIIRGIAGVAHLTHCGIKRH